MSDDLPILEDIDELAITAWGEARGEHVEGRIAVMSVIRNRVEDRRWGPSYAEVVHAPFQFSCWSVQGGVENYQAVQRLKEQILAQRQGDPIYRETRFLAQGILEGSLLDRVQGATHYFAVALDQVPAWARGKQPVCRVGGHAFYRDIA